MTAATSQTSRARIAILIDDMGDNLWAGEQALALPGAVSYAFLPHTAFAPQLARAAHHAGRDVLLHAPMQSEAHLSQMGPGALTRTMTEAQTRAQFLANVAAIPYVRGFNNHMGSVLTRDRMRMQWLMQEAHALNLFFVDSRTTTQSVAASVAREHGLHTRGRDVFLDHDQSVEAVRAQFRQLLRIAKERGSALAIGHPHRSTLQVLREELNRLPAQQVELVPVSRLSAPQFYSADNSAQNAGKVSTQHTAPIAKESQPEPITSSKIAATTLAVRAKTINAKDETTKAPSIKAVAAKTELPPTVKPVPVTAAVSAPKISQTRKSCPPIQFNQQQLQWHQALLAGEQLAQWLACQKTVASTPTVKAPDKPVSASVTPGSVTATRSVSSASGAP